MLDYPEQPVTLVSGEAMLPLGAVARAPTAEEAKAHIFSATNVQPPSGRCCFISGGVVTAILNADPAIDSTPAGTLVASDVGNVNDRYANGLFQRRYAVVQIGTGRVTAIVYANPAASVAPNFVSSLTLSVGDIAPSETPKATAGAVTATL